MKFETIDKTNKLNKSFQNVNSEEELINILKSSSSEFTF